MQHVNNYSRSGPPVHSGSDMANGMNGAHPDASSVEARATPDVSGKYAVDRESLNLLTSLAFGVTKHVNTGIG